MTEPTTTDRQSKPAADLMRGDQILTNRVHDHIGPTVHKVLIAAPYGSAGHDVTVMVEGGYTFHCPRDTAIDLATAAEIAAVGADDRREKLLAGLRNLHRLIESNALPVIDSMPRFSVVLDTRAELDQWAQAFGAEVIGGGPDGTIPVVRIDYQDVRVNAQCMEPMPAPAVEPAEPADPAPVVTWPASAAPADTDVDEHDASNLPLPITPLVDPALRHNGSPA